MKPMNTTVRFAASLKFNVEGGRKRKANIPGREREREREMFEMWELECVCGYVRERARVGIPR
jgi:hypothetical protein